MRTELIHVSVWWQAPVLPHYTQPCHRCQLQSLTAGPFPVEGGYCEPAPAPLKSLRKRRRLRSRSRAGQRLLEQSIDEESVFSCRGRETPVLPAFSLKRTPVQALTNALYTLQSKVAGGRRCFMFDGEDRLGPRRAAAVNLPLTCS